MADKTISPRPEVEFDFVLPHGVDATASEQNAPGDAEDHNTVEDIHDSAERDVDIDMRERSDSGRHSRNTSNDLIANDQDLAEGGMNYNTFEQGFSDDDDAPKAWDRSWTAHQARRSSPKSRKSPRDEEGDYEDSPKSKKPRQSLFGGLSEDVEEDESADHFEEQPEERLVNQAEDSLETPVPRHSIGNRMSSLNLDQQEREASPSYQQFHIGFDQPGDSDREDMSSRGSPALSDGEIVIPADTQLAYGLRQGIDRKPTYTYVDQDESGNFDPAQEAKNNALKLKQAKATKAAKVAIRSTKGKQRAPQETVMKCIVKLRFERFGNVRNATNEEDNWPEDWSDIDSEAKRELQEYRDFFRSNTPGRDMQDPIQDPISELDDLTGHPIARGCISCRENEMDCSLVGGGTYPCQDCCDRDKECAPIIAPAEKGRCKQCVGDGIERCSFEDEPGQAICDYCAFNEHICDALPPVGYRAQRIIIDEEIYTENRPHIQCTNCRLEKKRCSLKKKTHKPPCKHCKKNNIGCTFWDIAKPVKEKKGKVKGPTEGDAPEVAVPGHDYFTKEDLEDMYGEDEPILARSPTPELEMEDQEGRKGMLTKIKTSFAHPIHFGSIKEDTSDCNFCELPVFGFTGLFEKEVHVIRWYNGAGYTEVGGGHAESYKDGTNMCKDCAFGRLQIVSCPAHELQHIFPNGASPNFEGAFADLLEAGEISTGIQQQLERWCSFCFTPATFVCRTSQVSLLDEQNQIDGCGLRLCTGCQVKLTEQFDGDSSLMAEILDHEPKAGLDDDMDPEKGMAVRADVGLLCNGGLLINNLALGTEADEQDF